MEFYDYLEKNYGVDTPILTRNINRTDMKKDLVRKKLQRLTEKGYLSRFDTGVYYIPTETLLGPSTLSTYDVVVEKYIKDANEVFGVYFGYTLLNQIGATTQVPNTLEIVSNYCTPRKREVKVRYMNVILRRPYVEITKENYREIQILELFRTMEVYSINSSMLEKIWEYVASYEFDMPKLKAIAKDYPFVIQKYIEEFEGSYEFA